MESSHSARPLVAFAEPRGTPRGEGFAVLSASLLLPTMYFLGGSMGEREDERRRCFFFFSSSALPALDLSF